MNKYKLIFLVALFFAGFASVRAAKPVPVQEGFAVQCPGDNNGDAVIDSGNPAFDNVRCEHIGAGDGFVNMSDGTRLYMFGFSLLTGTPLSDVMQNGTLAAEFPAPTLVLEEGEEFYLTMSNVGMEIRGDLFDPHTVHFHGFPNASAVFDGVPDASVSINMGASITYYYNLVDPGTYMYHCHVEATEHMQMGMLGNLYVKPAQNKLTNGTLLSTPELAHVHSNGDTYVYNDSDGSTIYDVEFALQLGGFDPDFHDASETVQPLPFAGMRDTYPMINGRGYPDTVNPAPLPQAVDSNAMPSSQKESSLIQATVGQKILLRISNLNITVFHTLMSPSIPMRVVGLDARELRQVAADNNDVNNDKNKIATNHYTTHSVSIGGGMAADVILDTTGIAPGTYFLYASNLHYLDNRNEAFGGMLTEIRINP